MPAQPGLDGTGAHPVTAEGSAVKETAFLGKLEVSRFQNQLRGGGLGPKMVWIPAGSFDMGGASLLSGDDEQPKHKVQIAKFAISIHEITWADYLSTGQNRLTL
jgi:formylglycine-generating enzyme required for sulfatase activity